MVYLERLAERALLLFCLSDMSTASGDDHSPMLVGLSKVSGHQRATSGPPGPSTSTDQHQAATEYCSDGEGDDSDFIKEQKHRILYQYQPISFMQRVQKPLSLSGQLYQLQLPDLSVVEQIENISLTNFKLFHHSID